jgi:predicted nucleic acid-binding protein
LTFVDTSGILAVIDAAQPEHKAAAQAWEELVRTKEELLTTSYVLVELFALVQSRFGIPAVQALDAAFSIVRILWIDAEIHRAALSSVLAASRRNLSLVDCASFEIMRRYGVRTAFAIDRDFLNYGFHTIPD